MRKKIALFGMLVILLIPVLAFSFKDENKGYAQSCYSTSTVRTYKHEDYIPKSITHREGNHAGTLYYDSHYHANYQVYATFKGVVCTGGLPDRIINEMERD